MWAVLTVTLLRLSCSNVHPTSLVLCYRVYKENRNGPENTEGLSRPVEFSAHTVHTQCASCLGFFKIITWALCAGSTSWFSFVDNSKRKGKQNHTLPSSFLLERTVLVLGLSCHLTKAVCFLQKPFFSQPDIGYIAPKQRHTPLGNTSLAPVCCALSSLTRSLFFTIPFN